MTEIERKIIKARPSLRKILPVVYWQTVVFAVLNLALAPGLYLWRPVLAPLVSPDQFAMTLWSVAFASVGAALIVGLRTKRWERLRGIMCVGFAMKLTWAASLILRIQDGGTLLAACLFLGLAALQAVVIIYYLPPDEAVHDPAGRL